MKNRNVEAMCTRWLKTAIMLVFCAASMALTAQPVPSAKLKDSTAVNPARPLDTIYYTLDIENLSDEDLKKLNINRIGDPNTTMIPGSFQSTPIAIPVKFSDGLEDQMITLNLKALDPDGDALAFTIVQNPQNGTLSGLTPLSANMATINYQPNTGFNGSDQFSFSVMDDDGNRDTSSFEIIVQSVNDAPSFTAGADVDILEDAGGQSLVWASDISAGPADESGQTLTFNILSNDNADLFENQPEIAPDGTLTFAAKANASGVATLQVQLMDNGGTANGGVDVSAPQVLTITVQSVNDAPSLTAGADVDILEDAGAQSLVWASDISAGPADEIGQTLTFNILSNDNADLFENQPEIAPDGTLTFAAKANASGVATLQVQLMDNGGTANGGVDVSAPQVLTITVQSVNDAPSFTKGIDISAETTTDSLIFTNWATDISAGPSDEASQTVTFIVESVDNESLFEILPQVTPNGTLFFKANLDAVGIAMVTIKLMDDAGTVNGGIDTSDSQSFTIELTPAGG